MIRDVLERCKGNYAPAYVVLYHIEKLHKLIKFVQCGRKCQQNRLCSCMTREMLKLMREERPPVSKSPDQLPPFVRPQVLLIRQMRLAIPVYPRHEIALRHLVAVVRVRRLF